MVRIRSILPAVLCLMSLLVSVSTAAAQPDETRTIQVTAGLNTYTLKLVRVSQRAEDVFRVRIIHSNELIHDFAAPPEALTYRGHIAGDESSVAAASIIPIAGEERVFGMLDLDAQADANDRFFFSGVLTGVVTKVEGAGETASRSCPVECGHCGESKEEVGSGESESRPTDPIVAMLAIDSDSRYYAANESSVERCVHDIEQIVNVVNLIYEIDLNVTHRLSQIVVRTRPEFDPYADHGVSTMTSMLNQLQFMWTGDAALAAIPRDIVHLFTGLSTGSIAGFALSSSVCRNDAFGVSLQSLSNKGLRASIVAHEIGHNWGAGHCSGFCGIMQPTASIEARFAPVSIAQMSAYIARRECQTLPVPPVLQLPIDELFVGTPGDQQRIDPNTWMRHHHAAVSFGDGTEPSPDRNLNLRADPFIPVPSTALIVSHDIAFRDESDHVVELSYWLKGLVNNVGGEAVILESLASDGNWEELDRVVFGTQFISYHYRPIYISNTTHRSVYHDRFRLRWRFVNPNPIGTTSRTAEAFIDNVTLRRLTSKDEFGEALYRFSELWFESDALADFNRDGAVDASDLIGFTECLRGAKR